VRPVRKAKAETTPPLTTRSAAAAAAAPAAVPATSPSPAMDPPAAAAAPPAPVRAREPPTLSSPESCAGCSHRSSRRTLVTAALSREVWTSLVWDRNILGWLGGKHVTPSAALQAPKPSSSTRHDWEAPSLTMSAVYTTVTYTPYTQVASAAPAPDYAMGMGRAMRAMMAFQQIKALYETATAGLPEGGAGLPYDELMAHPGTPFAELRLTREGGRHTQSSR
jgi:hypothetical protein